MSSVSRWIIIQRFAGTIAPKMLQPPWVSINDSVDHRLALLPESRSGRCSNAGLEETGGHPRNGLGDAVSLSHQRSQSVRPAAGGVGFHPLGARRVEGVQGRLVRVWEFRLSVYVTGGGGWAFYEGLCL